MNLRDKLRIPLKLKEISRTPYAGERHETTAEHTFSAIALGEYFLKKYPEIDELKVIKLLLYHDYAEIYAGDADLLNELAREKKEIEEKQALARLEKELPTEIAREIIELNKEYHERKTIESKFAKAIDVLDPMLQSLKSKKEWIECNYTEEKLRAKQLKYLNDFPELKQFWEEMVEELLTNKAITKK
ncbi:MAG: HD domain-containing protein [archaeon]|jgi:putative hydrolase of HD superfamily